MEEFEKRERISKTAAQALIATAIFIDFFLQGITLVFNLFIPVGPFIGTALSTMFSIFAGLTFWLWFKMLDVTLFDSLQKFVITFFKLFEFIPILNFLPIWTLSTVLTILIVWREDRAYNKEALELHEQGRENEIEALQEHYRKREELEKHLFEMGAQAAEKKSLRSIQKKQIAATLHDIQELHQYRQGVEQHNAELEQEQQMHAAPLKPTAYTYNPSWEHNTANDNHSIQPKAA